MRGGALTLLWLDDDQKRWPGVIGFLRDEFELTQCTNYSDALRELQRHSFDLLILDFIVPFGSAQPSIGPYLGLTFADELLDGRNGFHAPHGIAVFSVISNSDIDEEVIRLREKGARVGVIVEYFNKTQVLLAGIEQFVRELKQIAEGLKP